ncbi:MAG: TonB-dependent receptor [Bacteroidetes bacterium]|nr:TonB-dependent receptor [Fibrella sp.]
MKRLYGLLIGALLISPGLVAQIVTLSGTVRDSATRQPLVRASVVIDFQKGRMGTSTDAQGHYSLDVPVGDRLLVIRHVGYKPYRKALRLQGYEATADAPMITVASQLEEVVVTSRGFDRNVREPLLGVSQISVETLRKLPSALGEVDLLRGLQMLPGVTSVGEAANGVNIRGGTTDQTLMLLDDTPIFNPTHMFGLFSVFPPDAVSGIDLYKSNVPARYGGRTASVMDVAVRNPNLEQFRLSGGVSLVSNRLTADIPIVKNKLGVMLSGRGAFNDFLLPLASEKLNGIKAQFGDLVLKTFWRIDNRNTLTVTGYFSSDFFQTTLLGSLPNLNATTTQYAHQTTNAMARWLHVISPRLNLQTSAIYTYYIPRILLPELNSGNKVVLRSGVLQRQLKSSLNYQLPNQKVEVGVNATNYRIEPGTLLPGNSPSVNYVTTPTENALELSAYADDELSLGPRLAVSAGLRYSHFLALGPGVVRQYAVGEPVDDFSVVDSTRYGRGQVTKTYGGFEPRLGIRYDLTPTSSVKFGYNLMRQYLQVVTNTTTPLPTARWKTSDEHVNPQISQLAAVGYFRNLKNNIYELSLEAYYRITENAVDYKPGASFLLQANPETQLLRGRSRAYGLETMITKKKGELTGWVNYTFARTLNQVRQGIGIQERINGGNWYRANYDRPHTLNASVTINVDKHNSLGFTFAYSTGRPYTAPNGYVSLQDNQNPTTNTLSTVITNPGDFGTGTIQPNQYPYYNERNNNRLPDYHRLDFSWNIYNATLKEKRWQGNWVFTVYNLYGRKNAYSAFFRTENGKTNAYKLEIFAAPIVSLTYNFVFK